MWQRRKSTTENKNVFTIVLEPTYKKSKVQGVTITQVVLRVPLGKSTPDFHRKPMAMTVNEGRRAFFKAIAIGEPTPSVTWKRNKGDINDAEKYNIKYNERNKEHILEIPKATADLADTYQCYATNEYGTAMCSVPLSVIQGETQTYEQAPQDFRKKQLPPQKEGELDPKLLEILLSAPKKDYQRICLDFGVTDFRWLLKKLNQMKKEREDEQGKVVENLRNVKQIEIKPHRRAEFSLDMTLRDPNSKIYLYKDGSQVPYSSNGKSRYSMQKRGNTYCFTIKDPQPEDAGLYQVDVGEINVLTSDFRMPAVEFASKINNVKALERKEASFQCVLSKPLNRITWSTSDSSLEHGDKYDISVSEDKLIHTLTIKNCDVADNGTYYAIAGTASCNASLAVEGKKKPQKDVTVPPRKSVDLLSAPSFITPLRYHIPPEGYECQMSCAVKGDPAPNVAWYRDNVDLSVDSNYYITNVRGVCSLFILRVRPNDGGVYKVHVENHLGSAECSKLLSVRGKFHILPLYRNVKFCTKCCTSYQT
uniref:Immunoglobulin-like and fibronectin type III domain-containing protein 1 n=1 Tax=Hippocampus comes TaxID=109280 RepID=A0A3Q3D283_HIPCM